MTKPETTLSLFDCICIIVGIIIGSGIYGTTPLITRSAGNLSGALFVWIFGGFLILNALLSYAELVTAHPRRGGDYAFLNLAYGSWVGFLFAWTEFWIIRPANIGAMAFVYAVYANELQPLGSQGVLAHAMLAVAALTGINLLGVRTGTRTQNVLTTLKVVGLLLVLIAACFGPTAPESAGSTEKSMTAPGFQLALILVLFTYGGGNDVSYVAAEVRDPKYNLPRALSMGIALVIAIYVLINLAFFRVLGYDGVSSSQAVAADMMQLCVGSWGARAISILVCISCLGAISAMILTGSRIYHAMGVDHPIVGWLGRWNQRGVPHVSIIAQGIVMTAMVLLVGRDEMGFERLAIYAAPFFWLFFTLVALSIFVFRRQRSRARRQGADTNESGIHFAPFYPFGPILFLASCVFMLYSSAKFLYTSQLMEAPWSLRTFWSLGVLTIGLAIGLFSRPRNQTTEKVEPTEPSASQTKEEPRH